MAATIACVPKNVEASLVGNPLAVKSAAVALPPETPATPVANAAARSDRELAGVPGVLVLLHQLFTTKLNLSPLITFKIIAGPILLPAPFTFATCALPGGVLAG